MSALVWIAIGWFVLSIIATVVFAALMHGAEPMAPAEPEDELAELFREWPEGSRR